MDAGYFVHAGLAASLAPARGAIAQMREMMADRYQFALTAMDNVAGYSEGQSDVRLAGFDLVAIGGLHAGSDRVVTRPEIRTLEEVRGHAVAVDALQSGYGFLLYGVLAKHGLRLNRDYGVIAVGSGPARLAAMKEGKAVAAVLDAPNDFLAAAAGCNILGDAVAELGAYQGTVYATRRGFAERQPDVVVAFLRAVIAAHRAIFADKPAALAVLRRHLPVLSAEQAETAYLRLTTGPGGFDRDAALNLAAIRTTLALRSAYAEPRMSLTEATRYIETRYYDRAAVAAERPTGLPAQGGS
jgi:ABC-type nitrate/sulfonate/bicarbonate transport system substrate-binding protein